MPHSFRRKASYLERSLLLKAVASTLGCSVVAVHAQEAVDPAVEEVLVTGSYLRGSPIDGPSPVQVIDRNAIEYQGAAQVWDIIKNLEANSGSVSNQGSGENTQVEGIANINLRNLGENSTLTLINGKRQVSAATTTRSGGEMVDINTIPMVMLDRVEVLTDGGSAIYGSDAVAGAVNFIMRTDFEGFELYGDVQNVEAAGDLFDSTASAIWGWSDDASRTHLVIAGERFTRDPVPVKYANYFDENSRYSDIVGATPDGAEEVFNSPMFGANFNMAYYNPAVVARNVAEGGSDLPIYTDPLCTSMSGANGEAFFVGHRADEAGDHSGDCREDVSDWHYINQGMERNSLAVAFDHHFSDKAQFYSFWQWSDTRIERTDNGAVSSRGPTVYLAAPGSHTGNPAWGGYAIGQTAELGFYAPAVGLARPTVIANAPNALANGGMNSPFWSTIRVNTPRTGGNSNVTNTETLGVQAGMKGEFLAFDDRRITYDLSYSWSGTSFEQSYRTLQRDRAELAANGLGGPNCTPNGTPYFDFRHAPGPLGGLLPTFWNVSNGALGDALTQVFFPGFVFSTRESLSLALTSNNQGQGGCQFYNPFLTSVTNPNLANSQELIDWMTPTVMRADKRNKLGVVDLVVTGELLELPGGMAQVAAGAQYRMQNNKSRAPAINYPGLPNAILGYDANGVPNQFHYVSNNFECAECIFNYDHDRNVKAVFTELSLPFANHVESQFALRWEDYGGNIGSEVTPKVAASWRPVDELLLRGSFSQSFRAPNIGIVKEGLEASFNIFRDPLRNQAVRAGLLPPSNEYALPNFTYTVGVPEPSLGNEHANTFNAGFIWTPQGGALDGLSVNADFWRFELKDKVLPQPGISAIAGELEAFTRAAADPANYILNSSLSANASVAFESCDPTALEAQYGRDSAERLNCVVDPRTYVVPGVVRTFGSTTAELSTTVLSTINAGTIVSDGVDLKLGYGWENALGRFQLGLDYTHVRQYKLIDVPGLELGLLETGVFDAAGTTGDGNLVRSLPDNRGNLHLNWNRDRHSATAITRVVGSYRDLSYDSIYATANSNVRSLMSKKIDTYQSWDFQYSYAMDWANSKLPHSVFTVGILDAFNADLTHRESGTTLYDSSIVVSYDSSVFDGRGRRLYARVLMQF
ncbi:MAG: TonB-dependent receptor [Pseudomonadales bacterium]|nr:TonB-dependent receptor [Pseudomonadales bacterium]MCP5358059.1 TonB-dependent receptor [Pseudomonadales bacterium]